MLIFFNHVDSRPDYTCNAFAEICPFRLVVDHSLGTGLGESLAGMVFVSPRSDELRQILNFAPHVPFDSVQVFGDLVVSWSWILISLKLISFLFFERLRFLGFVELRGCDMLLWTGVGDQIFLIKFRSLTRKGYDLFFRF